MADRVIWVTSAPPHRAGSGAQLRQAMLLESVAHRVPVVLVSTAPVTDPHVRSLVADVVEVPVPPPPRRSHPVARRLDLARRLVATGLPLETADAKPQRVALANAVREVVRPDGVVVVEHLELAPLAESVAPASRRVLTIHHAAGRQAAQQLALATTARRRWWWRVQRRRVRALERWAGRTFDVVVTVSDLDAAAVACDSVVVPNAVRFDRPVPPRPGNHTVVFTGTLDYRPNIDGITWFATTAWPCVRAALPEARLWVVGRAPTPQVRALDELPGVEVHPDVDEVDPWIEGADVAVVPLRIGGGTRLKALQAMAAARPVVGTSIGLEGLGVQDRVHAWVADTHDALADGVLAVLRDPVLGDRLGRDGFAHGAATHDWQVAGERFASRVLGLGT